MVVTKYTERGKASPRTVPYVLSASIGELT